MIWRESENRPIEGNGEKNIDLLLIRINDLVRAF